MSYELRGGPRPVIGSASKMAQPKPKEWATALENLERKLADSNSIADESLEKKLEEKLEGFKSEFKAVEKND